MTHAKILFLLFGLFIHFASVAQNQKSMDSISVVLRNTSNQSDTNYLNIFNGHAFEYRTISVDSSLVLSLYAKQLCEKVKYSNGIASASINIGTVYRIKGIPGKALENFQNALDIAKTNNNLQIMANAHNSIGNIYAQIGELETAITHNKQSLSLSEILGNDASIVTAYGNMATIYLIKGDYAHALDYFFKAEAISEKIGDKVLLADIWEHIATIYDEQGNKEDALKYYDKSLKLATTLNNQSVIANVLHNSGYIYLEREEYTKALNNYLKVLEIAKITGNQLIVPSALASIGMVYYKQNQYEKSLPYFQESLKLSKIIENEGDKSYALQGLALNYFKLNKPDKSLQYINESLALAYAIEDKELIRDAYKMLYEIYKQKKDYPKALYHHEKFKSYYDSLYNAEVERKITTLGTKYEFDKKENLLKAEQQKKNEVYEAQNRQQQLFILLACLALIFTSIIIFVVLRSRKKIQLANEEIKQKNEEIRTQSENLVQINATKDKLFSIISHDLRTPLGSLKTSLEMLQQKIFTPDEFIDFSQSLNQSVERVFFMLENLLQWSYSQISGEYTKQEKFDITGLLKQNIELFSEVSRIKNITLEEKTIDNLSVLAEKNQIDLVVRNLISNAIKFTKNGGNISVLAIQKQNFIEVAIKDSGIGLSASDTEKIFSITTHTTRKGTANEKGTGLGLILCKEMVEKNGGKIWVESTENMGTTFYFTVPTA